MDSPSAASADGEGLRRAGLIAGKRKRRRDLGAGKRRCDRVDLGIREITEIADDGAAVPRQHIMCIREVGRLGVVRELALIAEHVLQARKRHRDRALRHLIALFAGTGQDVGDIGIEPQIVAARRPEAEAAGRGLTRENAADHLLRAFARALGKLHAEIFGVEDRDETARKLFRAAIGIESQARR